MSGIVVPTIFLIFLLTVYAYNRYYFEVSSQFVVPLPSAPLDRAIVFPMAVVPNAWGLWNMLYLRLHARPWSIGAHGALLPLLLMPFGFALVRSMEVLPPIQWQFALPMIPVGMTVYYLAWKYLVGFLNQEVGIS
jgi:hypothetical protein